MAKGGSASVSIGASFGGGRAASSAARSGFGSVEVGRSGGPSNFSSRGLSRFNNAESGRPKLQVIENKNFNPKIKGEASISKFKPQLAIDNKFLIPKSKIYNEGSKPLTAANDNRVDNVGRALKFVNKQAANDNFPVSLRRFNNYNEWQGVNDNRNIDASLPVKVSPEPAKHIKVTQVGRADPENGQKSGVLSKAEIAGKIKYSPELSRVIAGKPIFEREAADKGSVLQAIERKPWSSALEVFGKSGIIAADIKINNPENPRVMKEEIKTALKIKELQSEIRKISKANETVPSAVKFEVTNPSQGKISLKEAEARDFLANVSRDLKKGKIEPLKIKPTSERIMEIQVELRSMAQRQAPDMQKEKRGSFGVLGEESNDPKKKPAIKREEEQKNKFYVIDGRARGAREEMAKAALRKMRELTDLRENFGSGIGKPKFELPDSPPKSAISEIANTKDGSYKGFRSELTAVDRGSLGNIDTIIKAANDNNNPVATSDKNINAATREEVQKVLKG